MNGLESKIYQYNEAYRSGNPIITDQEYDNLVEQLKIEKPDSELFKKGIIESPKKNRKQKLPIPMFSLDKCKSITEIKNWLKSNNISESELLIITPKFDGISLVVDERNNDAWTRGDGVEGQYSQEHFLNVSRKLDGYHREGRELFSFGEVIMSNVKFLKYKDLYANARNMVAGLFNRDIPTKELNDVDYIRYGCDLIELNKDVQLENLNLINKIKCQYTSCTFKDLNEKFLNKLYNLWKFNYQIDGLVIEINSSHLRNELGREENMNPKFARAYKNPDWSGSAEVKVKGVNWDVSKQGKLKPVIKIEPTEVSGVIIENVTGYNAKYIFDNNISEGSIIKIIRSGDVIPKHIETISYNKNEVENLADEITSCPCCGNQTIWDDTMTELICFNNECEDRNISKLVHFFNTLKIEDFGEPSIIKLYKAGFTSIYNILSICKEELIKVGGYGLKSSERLVNQFKNLLEIGTPLARTIHAIDVMEGKIGEKTIQMIFDHLTDKQIFGLIDFDLELHKKLLDIKGVSNITAITFIEGMVRFNNFWYDLPIKTSYTITPKQEIKGNKFKGQKLCFTGCRPSEEQEQMIISEGGEIISGVSKNTTMLVVKDLSEKVLSSSKANKAKALGIKIIEIKEL